MIFTRKMTGFGCQPDRHGCKLLLQLPAERSHESKNRNSLAQVAQVKPSQHVMPDGSGRPVRLFLSDRDRLKSPQVTHPGGQQRKKIRFRGIKLASVPSPVFAGFREV